MTEQPVETEQQYLGNAPTYGNGNYFQPTPVADIAAADHGALPPAPLQHYVPNAHRGRFSPLRDKAKQDIQDAIAERAALNGANPSLGAAVHQQAILDELSAAAAPLGVDDIKVSRKTDLLLEAEMHTTHALAMIQNNELDAGIAWLQSALAMALNQRHVEQFGGARA